VNSQNTNENKKGFFQNDKLLVCSMFVFYGLCIIGLIAGAFVWLGQRNAAIAANATSTAQKVAMEKANATATAAAHTTEQAQYEFIESFDSNKRNWLAGADDDSYAKSDIKIADGVYVWDIQEVKKTFIYWADFPLHSYMQDFDVYVDTKIIDENPGDACSGFQFRVHGGGWDFGGYYFALCSNGVVTVSYHTEKDGWESITKQYYPIVRNSWNRLEITARGSHFIFLINGQEIYEMDDDRREAGELTLVIELNEKVPATILFDNLGLEQIR